MFRAVSLRLEDIQVADPNGRPMTHLYIHLINDTYAYIFDLVKKSLST